jgi:hypothetical protein
MRIAEVFSFGCGHSGHGSSGGYGGSKRHYRREDYFQSSYDDSRRGDHYEGGGLLGIFGGN